jgi:hypothetical protein
VFFVNPLPINLKAKKMELNAYRITFEFQLRPGKSIPLTAEAELHHSDPYFVVSNITRTGRESHPSILPDVKIKKASGHWVHCDSGKESDLSIAIGKAIDESNLEIQ